MYAVISAGGKQYRVEQGTTFLVEKLPDEAGSSVTLDQVLLVSDGDDIRVGTPTVPGASVTVTVLGEQAGEKVIIFKYKQKARYRRRTGHRQHYTQLRVDGINLDSRDSRDSRDTAKVEDDTPKKAAAPRKAPATKKAAADEAAPDKAAADEAAPKKAAPRKAPATKKASTKAGSD